MKKKVLIIAISATLICIIIIGICIYLNSNNKENKIDEDVMKIAQSLDAEMLDRSRISNSEEDTTPPKILIGSSFSVTEGYNKNLVDVLFSGDDMDDNPKREIIGEYDFNVVRRL